MPMCVACSVTYAAQPPELIAGMRLGVWRWVMVGQVRQHLR